MKKRIYSILLTLAMLFTFIPTQVFAAGNCLEITPASAKVGDEVTLTYTAQKKVNDLAAVSIRITFDSAKFEVTAVEYPKLSNFSPTGSNVKESNTNSWFSVSWTDEDAGLVIPANTALVKATLKVKAGGGSSSDFNVAHVAISDAAGTTLDNATNGLDKTSATVTIPKAPITTVTASVDAPVKGQPLDTTVDVGGATAYTAAVEWYEGTTATGSPVTGTAKPSQFYYAKITLKANPGETFADTLATDIVIGDYSVTRVSDTELTLTKAYPKTDTVKVTKVQIGGAAPTLNVPEATDFGVPGTVTVPRTYSVDVHTDGGILTNPSGVKWSVSGLDGVTVDPDTGDLTISSNCPGGKINLTATYGGVSNPKPATPTVFRAEPAVKWLKIVDPATGGAPQTTIIPPVGDDPADMIDVKYEAKVYDQFSQPATITKVDWTWNHLPKHMGTLETVGGPYILTLHVFHNTEAIPFDLTATLKANPAIKDTVKIKVENKPLKTLEVTQADTTYGTALAAPVFTVPEGTTKTLVHYSTPTSSAYSSDTPPTNAGEYVVNVVCETATHIYTGHANFKIEPKSISNMLQPITGTYVYSGGVQKPTAVVMDGTKPLVEGTGKTVNVLVKMEKGGLGENYPLNKDTTTATVNINKIDPTVPTGLKGVKGQKLSTVELPAGWTWYAPSMVMDTAGTQTFLVNYAGDANHNDLHMHHITVNVLDKTDVSTFITFPDGEKEYTGSYMEYKAATISGTNLGTGAKWNYVYTAGTGTLLAGYPQGIGTYTVTATYEDSSNFGIATATLTITAKKVAIPAADTTVFTYDGNAKTYGISDTADYTVTGNTQTNAGDHTVTVALKDKATTAWADGTTADKTYTFTIKQATPTGEPACTKITTSGKKLSDAALTTTGGTFSVPGTVKWVDDTTGADLPDTTTVEANKLYKWVFTPTDSTNYESINGTIKLWSKSTSSGGGSYYAPVVPDMPMVYWGCTGDAVKTLQEKLNAKGFNSGNVDGIFGAKTYAAVTAFQKANSLGVDGIVGKLTWAKLYDATPVNVTPVTTQPMLRTGSRGDAVRKLQELLNAKGYTCGSVDGIFGSKTYAAVLAFQKANGLAADGIVGSLTWGKLV